MDQFFRLLRMAARKGNKQLLSDWFNDRQSITLPDIASTQHFRAKDFQSRLAAFNSLHSWHHTHLHPCFAQFLGLSQHISALADKHSPFSLMGLVQTENTINCKVPLSNDDMTINCRFSAIELHPHGITVDVTIDVVQRDNLCVSASSTYLYRLSSEQGSRDTNSSKQHVDATQMTPIPGDSQLYFNADAGRKYARISGDYNPIHYYNWSARLFGFKSSIAHGMHVLAHALSKLEGSFAIMGDNHTQIANRFLYPATLPCATVMSYSQATPDLQQPLAFALSNPAASRRKQRILEGTISRLG